jgi:DNA mismatch repair protein MutS
MMQQYDDAKAACGDALLLFRMGDFYELFFEDAKVAAKVLGLTLTSRDKGENPIPMAGFPYHQLDGYMAKMIASGHRVAVCEQVEDPKAAKGLVKREITRVVSPGTVTDDALLDPKEANFLLAICSDHGKGKGKVEPRVGLAWADLSTGRFLAASFPESQLADQMARLQPAECLVSEDAPPLEDWQRERTMVTSRPGWMFGLQEATKVLELHFHLKRLDGLGFDAQDGSAIRAAGALLAYLQETQKNSLQHLERVRPYLTGSTLEIDESTRRSLEISRTLREGRREGSLLSILDRCVTSMGSRLLSDWVANPLVDLDLINQRLSAVEEMTLKGDWCRSWRERLAGTYDIERLLSRIVAGRATPRDLSSIGRTLAGLPTLVEMIQTADSPLLVDLASQLDPCEDIAGALNQALESECPLVAREGGFIRSGINEELDRLRELATGGKEWIARYQAEISQSAGIPNLKVGFNKVFGYYLEVTAAHWNKVPDTFIRKQTLKNAERYITPELKEYEEKVLTADDRAKQLEYDLFLELRQQVFDAAARLQGTARVLATLDVIAGLGDLAIRRRYCRPEVVEDPELRIEEARHPVLDVTEPEGTFVPNDTIMSADDGMIMLITGPNMAGKSTYIRQVALLTLMAQLGSFVPARKARIGVADRIFARVGASDELSRGQSTFMVEMTETARILNTASSRSLVILDEIGRGTSTYDGVSLAWAIVEHIHDQIGSRTLFATHYHELTDLQSTLRGVRNFNVSVKEWDDQVVFLHKIIAGAADKSYGIHVARLAGVPVEVNERAKQVLSQLEDEHLDANGRPKISPTVKEDRKGDIQLTLFGTADHPLLDAIRQTDINGLTPLEALQLVALWQDKLKAEVRES